MCVYTWCRDVQLLDGFIVQVPAAASVQSQDTILRLLHSEWTYRLMCVSSGRRRLARAPEEESCRKSAEISRGYFRIEGGISEINTQLYKSME